jgi:vacuolar-type H+-ATPase subunit E/Vma4
MRTKEAMLKEKLLEKYSKELDELFAKSRETKDFGALERQVSELAEHILPSTLSELQTSKDFSPSMPRVPGKGKK